MSKNTTRKVSNARRLAPTSGVTTAPKDYAQTVATVKAAGTAYKRAASAAVKNGDKAVDVAVEATILALAKGFLWVGEKADAPEHSVSRAAYGRTYFGLTNGSLVTFWCTLADARSKGVTPDSALYGILAHGTAPVGRRGGIAEAIGKATDVAGVEKAVRAAGFDPKTGAKVVGTPKAKNVGGQAGAKPSDPVTAATDAVKALRAALPKVKDDESYLKVRAALAHLLDTQDKARKVGPYAAKSEAAA